MTDTKRYVLRNPEIVKNAVGAILEAGKDWTVTISPPKRSLDQNSFIHSICADIAKSGKEWAGQKRSAEDWKSLIVSAHAIATKQAGEVVPGLEGEFVSIRESTARMSKARASSLIEYAIAWATQNDIELTETKKRGFWE